MVAVSFTSIHSEKDSMHSTDDTDDIKIYGNVFHHDFIFCLNIIISSVKKNY